MYKVQYMNYKTREIVEDEFKHPKHALARYLTIGESMKENGIKGSAHTYDVYDSVY